MRIVFSVMLSTVKSFIGGTFALDGSMVFLDFQPQDRDLGSMSGFHLRVWYLLTLYVIDCAGFPTRLWDVSLVFVTVKRGISKGCNLTHRPYGGVKMTVGWLGKRKEPP